MRPRPLLVRCVCADGLAYSTDEDLFARSGIRIAFTERSGGVSDPPCDSLNLATHVGDDPGVVDENRKILLRTLGLGELADSLVTASQVHGAAVAFVGPSDAGRGARAGGASQPLADIDAIVTSSPEIPLLMVYADCVPVILIAEEPLPVIAVIHAGWRGVLAGVHTSALDQVCLRAGCTPGGVSVYIGPHIGPCCYTVGDEIISHFCNTFGTIAAVEGRLDLGRTVAESLVRQGVSAKYVADSDECTFDHADRFFSYRASRVTGRHGALAVITKVE